MDIKIRLEKFSESDFHDYFKLVNNEKVMKMITERPIELEEAKKDYEDLIQNNKIDPNLGNFKIIHLKTKEFLGLAKLEIKEEDNEEAELGYIISPDYWGKGIGSLVGKLLIEKAKAHKTIKQIYAIIDPENIPSRRILTNNGFTSKEFIDFDGLPGEILELILPVS